MKSFGFPADQKNLETEDNDVLSYEVVTDLAMVRFLVLYIL